MSLPVTIYAESTPNPAAMKFVCNMMLLENAVVEYSNAAEASACPMAAGLFSFSGVQGVFITSNFVTVTKAPGVDWYDITNIIREYIRGYLSSGEKLFITNPFTEKKEKVNPDGHATSGAVSDAATEQEIIKMLDEYVKPAVEQDGGAIHFRSFQNGVVTVALKGSCSGCPSSTLTLKAGIENLLKKMVPGVNEVVAEAE
jgi:NFU1 iron-sulfur cluster scaffold homolog, mitochondrial